MTAWPRRIRVGAGEQRASISAWATEVSWYSSRSTTLNRARSSVADVGLLARQPGGELDLVGEVHQPEVALEPAVVLDQPSSSARRSIAMIAFSIGSR